MCVRERERESLVQSQDSSRLVQFDQQLAREVTRGFYDGENVDLRSGFFERKCHFSRSIYSAVANPLSL